MSNIIAIYRGEGGYQLQREQASKVFSVNKKYEVVDAIIGGYATDIVLKDIPGKWNSSLFEVDFQAIMAKFYRKGVQG